jgi:hypothetical protein
LVGISSKPISRKISRKALLTLRRGWRWPDVGCVPSALKLYSLNVSVSHAPLHPPRACQHCARPPHHR